MKNLGELLQEYDERGDSMDSFEADHLNALLMNKGLPPVAGRGQLVNYGKGVRVHPNTGGGDKAQFDIRISRATAATALSNEVPLFGPVHFASGYVDRINPTAGGSFTVTGGVNVATFNNVIRVTHVNGVNTDITTISCNQVPYPTFLSASLTDLFIISNIRYSLDDPTQTSQFAQPFEVRTKSLFGKGGQNPISPASFKKPEQFQAGIIDMPVNIPMDKESYIVVGVAPLVIAFTLSIFVQRFHKWDKVDLAG